MTHIQNWFYSIIIIYLNWDLNTDNNNTTDATSGAGTSNVQLGLWWGSLCSTLIYDVVFCLSVWHVFLCIVCPSPVYGFWLPLYYQKLFFDKIRHNFPMIINVLTIQPKLLDLVNAIEKLTKVNVELAWNSLRWRKTKCIGYIL
jgi:hypothetical protein